MMNECLSAGLQASTQEAVTRNEMALLQHVKVHVSFFALVREIEEKLPVTEANGLPRSCPAGRV
jgi:hypothetical protein